ncbi:MAG: DUF1302 family protein, partial [Desulfobacteraceae bacterium]|nr:DUF1302 family protein [Desulfobacteraceae bacterium]
MRNKRKQKPIVFLAVLMFVVMAWFGSAAALQFDLGKDTTLDVDTTLTYAAGWRVKDAEKAKLGKFNPAAANTDDGNENFDQWDMINNKITAIVDIDVRHKNFGIFLRPRVFYDHAYMSDNANDSPGTNNNLFAGAINKTDEFDGETEDAHGQNVQLLDIFAYASFDVADRNVNLRVGRQVISWGESLFLSGGISSAQGHVDLTAANSGGVELKELFLPSEAVYVQADITQNISLSAYYQWKWEKHRLNESGSFFSTTDMLDEAGHAYFVAPGVAFMRGNDDEASDSGQFGVSFTYIADWLVGTEFGLYYLNYHEKAPGVGVAPPYYFLTFAEDVKLYGASVSSQIGDVNVSGEISYRQDFPIALNSGTQNANVMQAQVSWIYIYGRPPICDSVNFLVEVGFNQVMGLENDRLVKDKSAWGFSLTVQPNWIQILPRFDMTIPIVYKSNPKGISSYGTFVEGADSAS